MESSEANCWRVKYVPSARINKGPSRAPLMAKYGKSALIGISYALICLSKANLHTLPKRISLRYGDSVLSTAMSARDKCVSGSMSACAGTVNSPHRRKPKKATQQAAHNMILLWLCGLRRSAALILVMTSRVTGSLTREVFCLAVSFFIPLRTISNFGVSWSANSLWNPAVMCRLRTADR